MKNFITLLSIIFCLVYGRNCHSQMIIQGALYGLYGNNIFIPFVGKSPDGKTYSSSGQNPPMGCHHRIDITTDNRGFFSSIRVSVFKHNNGRILKNKIIANITYVIGEAFQTKDGYFYNLKKIQTEKDKDLSKEEERILNYSSFTKADLKYAK